MTHSCVSDKVTGAEELLMRSGPCLQCMSQNATGQCRCRWRWPQIVRVLEFHSPRTVLCCWQNVEFGLVTANGTLRINIQPFWNAKPMELDHLSSSNPQQENHLKLAIRWYSEYIPGSPDSYKSSVKHGSISWDFYEENHYLKPATRPTLLESRGSTEDVKAPSSWGKYWIILHNLLQYTVIILDVVTHG